jgi:hypothetical protein
MTTRKPRDAFLPILERLVRRIAADKVFDVHWKDRYLGNSAQTAHFRVQALYLFGSFARGAPTCNDLDVILEIAVEKGYHPPSSVVISAALGHVPHVDETNPLAPGNLS